MHDAVTELLRDNRLDEAERLCEKMLAATPEAGDALHQLGIVRWRRGEVAEAIALIERAIAGGNAVAHWHCDICEMYRLEGRLDEAARHGERAVALGPDDINSHYNLGLVHYDRGEIGEAIACQRRVLTLKPDHAAAHFELGETLLLDGDFRTGFAEYEWRFKMPGVTPPMPPTDRPAWRGEILREGRLLLVADQGFGDAIQFMRYVPLAAERVCSLTIACGAEIMPLVRQLAGKAALFQLWKATPAFDCHALLSNLPHLFGTDLDSIPAEVPYLHAEPARILRWQRRLKELAPAGHRRIGLVWAGRPTHGNDRNRSITLRDLAPLAALDNVTLVSLQKGQAGSQAGGYYGAAPLVNLAPEIGDFADTAAIIHALDLVITVDTSVAHLAGALGRPAWVLLPFAPDWRWLRHRADSPWYPTLRLYRQDRPGAWSETIARVAQDLS